MRTSLYSFLIPCLLAVGLMTGCRNDREHTAPETPGSPVSVTVGTTVGPWADEGPGAKSAPDNTAIDWTRYRLRYILEAWTKQGQRALRTAIVVAGPGETADLTIRLVPGSYDLLLWADIVPSDTGTADCHYLTDTPPGLRAVTLAERTYTACDETRDAFACHLAVTVDVSFTLPATLRRPLARLVLIDKNASAPGNAVTVSYAGPCDTYDVLTGVASQQSEGPAPVFPAVTAAGAPVGWDYVLVPPPGTLSVTATVGANKAVDMPNLPLEPNKRTVVTAPFTPVATNQ